MLVVTGDFLGLNIPFPLLMAQLVPQKRMNWRREHKKTQKNQEAANCLSCQYQGQTTSTQTKSENPQHPRNIDCLTHEVKQYWNGLQNT